MLAAILFALSGCIIIGKAEGCRNCSKSHIAPPPSSPAVTAEIDAIKKLSSEKLRIDAYKALARKPLSDQDRVQLLSAINSISNEGQRADVIMMIINAQPAGPKVMPPVPPAPCCNKPLPPAAQRMRLHGQPGPAPRLQPVPPQSKEPAPLPEQEEPMPPAQQ